MLKGEALTYGHHVKHALAIPEEATGIAGKVDPTDVLAFPCGMAFLPGAAVKFPSPSV
jgi:hypothetical protein